MNWFNKIINEFTNPESQLRSIYLPAIKKALEEKPYRICSRCGYTSHYVNNCFAKRHKDGNWL